MLVASPFAFEITSDTRPFHVFQQFVTYRKTRFKHWSVHHWAQESGVGDAALLTGLVRGQALPDDEVAEKLYDSMGLCQKTRTALAALIERARQKQAERQARKK